jgi:hypothetical protein
MELLTFNIIKAIGDNVQEIQVPRNGLTLVQRPNDKLFWEIKKIDFQT